MLVRGIARMNLHGTIIVIRAEPRHAPQMSDLAELVYPGVTGWPVEQLLRHQEIFPDGQLVAVEAATDRVVGASLNLIVDWARTRRGATYMNIIDEGWFGNHDVDRGDVMYAADLFVLPAARGNGVGAALLSARWEALARLGKGRILGSARLYRTPPSAVPLNLYLRLLQYGALREPALAFLVSRGARVQDLLMDHFSPDQDGCPHAILTEWTGPPLAGILGCRDVTP